MELEDIQAVIESAKARGTAPLERFVRQRMPDAPPEDVLDAVDLAVEIIETVPILLARAYQEARSRQLDSVVEPLLDHAGRYFLRPMDVIPEMTQGLAGLLDDAYLVLKVLQNLERGPEPLVSWDLDEPVSFLRSLLGERIGRQLDAMSVMAMQELSDNLTRLWQQTAHDA